VEKENGGSCNFVKSRFKEQTKEGGAYILFLGLFKILDTLKTLKSRTTSA